MIIRSADSQGLLLHTPKPMLSGIPTPTHTTSYAVQNYQTLEQFLESLYHAGISLIITLLSCSTSIEPWDESIARTHCY